MTEEVKEQQPKKRGRKPGRKPGIKKKLNRKEMAMNNEWYARLKEEEIGHDDKSGEDFVYFRGLARLAEEAGKISERIIDSSLQTLTSNNSKYYNLIAKVVVEVSFDDNTIWCGVADAHQGNCLKYSNHPSALAETRALARAYRRALGIHIVAFEETSTAEEGVMTGEPTSSQLSLIRTLAKKYDIKLMDLIQRVSKRDEVTVIEHLNYDEAQEAARYLNNEVAAEVAKKERKDERQKNKEERQGS